MAMLILPKVFQRTWGERSWLTDGSAPVDEPFSPKTIGRVKAKNPGFIFMAEVYWDLEWELMQQGFDYCYDKSSTIACVPDAAAVRAHFGCMAYLNGGEIPGKPREPRAAPRFGAGVPACGSHHLLDSRPAVLW